MYIKRNLKFVLHTRKKGDSINGKNLAIRMRLSYAGKSLDFPLGLNCDAKYWDAEKQCVKANFIGKHSQKTSDINKVIEEHRTNVNEFFARFELLEKRKPEVVEIKDLINEKHRREGATKCSNSKDLFQAFDVFLRTESELKGWSDGTLEKLKIAKKHLEAFNPTLKFSDVTEETLQGFLRYLQNDRKMINTSAMRYIGWFKWFLNWAFKKNLLKDRAYMAFKPKLKGTDGKTNNIVYLEWDELIHLLEFDFEDPFLAEVRDVFCFCCFTSLRYSDVAKLKRSDVKDDHILVVTKKTVDGLKIELNKYSRSILAKYKDKLFQNNNVLPIYSMVRMNQAVKDMGKEAKLDDEHRVIYFRKNERIEEVYPKHALLTTHCGRRTFVVNSLYLGIPAEVVMKWTGHSDFKAMKPYIKIIDKLKEREMTKFDEAFDKALDKA